MAPEKTTGSPVARKDLSNLGSSLFFHAGGCSRVVMASRVVGVRFVILRTHKYRDLHCRLLYPCRTMANSVWLVYIKCWSSNVQLIPSSLFPSTPLCYRFCTLANEQMPSLQASQTQDNAIYTTSNGAPVKEPHASQRVGSNGPLLLQGVFYRLSLCVDVLAEVAAIRFPLD